MAQECLRWSWRFKLVIIAAISFRRLYISRLMRYIKFFLALAAAISNANAAEFSSTENGRVINMVGSIVEGDSVKFLKTVTMRSKVIKVQSGGGETDEAMHLGRLIHDRNLDIEVNEICASSCANYLFPAAVKKIIPKGSMLGLHGTAQLTALASIDEIKKKLLLAGIAEEDLGKELPGFLQTFQKQALLEREYAKYLGIDASFYTDYRHVIDASSPIQNRFSGLNVEPLWWPSAYRFERCYHISNVLDFSRPIELKTEGYKLIAAHSFVFLGDIGLNECQ